MRRQASRYDAREREHWQHSARYIIDCDDVLELFAQSWRKVIAGEEKNAKLLYLAATSRVFSKCMNVAIKGPSSGGKSEIRRQVLEFFPPEAIVSFTTLSERALLYYEEDFAHKILSMGEAAGAEEQSLQDYLLRELISEGRLRYPVVQMKKGGLITTTIEKNGPVAFMVTTTKSALHPENETRMLSLEVDDSDIQTMSVLHKVAEIVGLNAEKAAIDFEPFRNHQRWLATGNCNVVIPFAEKLARLIPPRSVRLRRDFTQILLAIKAHALLHRRQRPVDDRGQIVADVWKDYEPVAALMGGLVAEASGAGITKKLQETIDAVARETADLPPTEGVAAAKIGKLLRLDKSSAWRRLNNATFQGFVVNLETRRGQPGRYRLTGQEVEFEELLPPPGALVDPYFCGTDATRQPARQAPEIEKESGCIADCNQLPPAEPVSTDCASLATPHAIANTRKDNGKKPPVVRLHGFSGGEQEEPCDGDPFSCLKDGKWGLQPRADDYPELPAELDRRPKR
jgi:hypothetical protein